MQILPRTLRLNTILLTGWLAVLPTGSMAASLAPVAAEHGMVVTAQHLEIGRASCRERV